MLFRSVVALGLLLASKVLLASQPTASHDQHSQSTCEAGVDCSSSVVAASQSAVFYNHVPLGIVKLNVKTGKPLWTFSPPKGWIGSNLIILGSRIFFSGNAWSPCGPVYALEKDTGKVLWSQEYSSCRIWSDGQRLYLQGDSGDGVRALDSATEIGRASCRERV